MEIARKRQSCSLIGKFDDQSEMVEPKKYISDLEKESKLCLLVIEPYGIYPTKIKLILSIISQLVQTMYIMASKVTTIIEYTKPL